MSSPSARTIRSLRFFLSPGTGVHSKNAFAASKILEHQGEAALSQRFSELQTAINVLKHGCGRSYDVLVVKAV
jgi:hypothetical protein